MELLTKKPKYDDFGMDTDAEDAAIEAYVCQAIRDVFPQPMSPFPAVVQMYMGKLHRSVTSDDILQLTKEFHVLTVLVTHPKRGNYAFITILEKDRENAMFMDGTVLKGQQIVVSKAREQKIPPLIIRMSHNRRIYDCQFSQSDEGRCEHDELSPLDGHNPNCPFGRHSMGHLAPVAKPKESTLEVCQEQILAEDRSTAKRRKKAAVSKGITEKCWEPSDRLPPVGEYIRRQNIE